MNEVFQVSISGLLTPMVADLFSFKEPFNLTESWLIGKFYVERRTCNVARCFELGFQ